MSATEAAALIRQRQVSSVELTELVLTRVDAVNTSINAVVELRRESALREAAGADQAVERGDPLGPLHGVPLTVKEAFNVEGMQTTWGDQSSAGYRPNWDATVVSRLRRAGAVIAGKTNVAFMLADFGQTANDLYGTTSNPWDTGRTPGGSSGGSAAAVAAGLSFLEYGSDLAGSIRIPAAFCGVYGLRPTAGIVPVTGLQPPGPPAPEHELAYLSAVGPLARSAADLRTALQVTAGPEAPCAKANEWRLAPPRHRRLADFRVGIKLDDPLAPVTDEVGAAISHVADQLALAGATVEEGWPAGVDPGQDPRTLGFLIELFFAYLEPPVSEFASLTTVMEHQRRRAAARAAWSRYFADVDVFLCPANFTTAFPHDARPMEDRTIVTPAGDRPYLDQAFWISHASLSGLPTVVAPIGQTATGLPVGIQIIGPPYEDDTAIGFAELLADVTGGYAPPPL